MRQLRAAPPVALPGWFAWLSGPGTVLDVTATVTVCGPGAGSALRDAVRMLAEVCAGRWGVVARMFPERFADPVSSAAALDDLGAEAVAERDAGRLTSPRGPAGELSGELSTPDDSTAVWVGPVAELEAALNVFMRSALGQLGELAWAAGMPSYAGVLTDRRRSMSAPGGWPSFAYASLGIGSDAAPWPAKVAYDVWKDLGAGAEGGYRVTGVVRTTFDHAV